MIWRERTTEKTSVSPVSPRIFLECLMSLAMIPKIFHVHPSTKVQLPPSRCHPETYKEKHGQDASKGCDVLLFLDHL